MSNGITLVALIITIIILIILAAVTIFAFRDSKLIEVAINGTTNYANAQAVEKSIIDELAVALDKAIEQIEAGSMKDGEQQEEIERPKVPEEQTKIQFSKKNGVIDVVWLDTQNNVINSPMSPKESLGGLNAIKYDGTDWKPANEDNYGNDWYNYIAQTGNTEEGGTSNWANARSSDGNAYFVWIPRYAYRITYFDTPENAEAYRNNRKSKEGIVGYSRIEGLVDASSETLKLVEGTEPINVTGKVKTENYADYIPHPAFEFDGAKAGIWIGKYECSGSKTEIKVLPNISSLDNINIDEMFTACQGVKTTYGLTSDSHMTKNIEWGAVAYLAESKYGRNGTKVSPNVIIGMIPPPRECAGGNYRNNFLQSTTGNVYGVYDMGGTNYDLVAGYIDTVKALQGQVGWNVFYADKKYKDAYSVTGDSVLTNYDNFKRMKGDAVFETSTLETNPGSWYQEQSDVPYGEGPFFARRRISV